jgi:hypothetical protein
MIGKLWYDVFYKGGANPNERMGNAYEYNYSNIDVGSNCYFFNRIE